MIKVELQQIVEDLYKFIQTIDLNVEWNYEFIGDVLPALIFKQTSVKTQKIHSYLAGGYDSEISFIVYHKTQIGSVQSVLDITKPLNHLADSFSQETMSNFPNLIFTNQDISPVLLEMVETPEESVEKENDVAIYRATYRLIYHKKGRYE